MKNVVLLLTLLTLAACAPSSGTSTGNPMVDLKMNSYNSTLAVEKSTIDALSLNSLKFCFKRLRFKQTASSATSENHNFYLGEVTISSLGTDLSAVSLPVGTYSRIEFDLDSSCPSGKSIELTNSNGSFSTDQTITIRFDGTFVHSNLDETLNLNIQQIVSSLNTVTSNSDVRTKAEAANGDF